MQFTFAKSFQVEKSNGKRQKRCISRVKLSISFVLLHHKKESGCEDVSFNNHLDGMALALIEKICENDKSSQEMSRTAKIIRERVMMKLKECMSKYTE